MNKITVIGNLTRDPEMRTTDGGVNCCNFTLAVKKRHPKEGEPDADFMKVAAWRALGDTCGKYLRKGRKVCVIGEAKAGCWMSRDGSGPRSQIEITAEDVEFLSSGRSEDASGAADPQSGTEGAPGAVDQQSGMEVATPEDLPY